MIFLVDYDRLKGRLVELRTFDDTNSARANEERLELEVSLNRAGIVREIVLLEAADEDALRKTHRRYFEDISELTTTAKEPDRN